MNIELIGVGTDKPRDIPTATLGSYHMPTTQLPPLPKKPNAVFHHPMGFALYDGLAMDMHAMKYADSALKEVDQLRLAEEGAKEAFAHVVQQKRDLEAEVEKLRKLLAGAYKMVPQQRHEA